MNLPLPILLVLPFATHGEDWVGVLPVVGCVGAAFDSVCQQVQYIIGGRLDHLCFFRPNLPRSTSPPLHRWLSTFSRIFYIRLPFLRFRPIAVLPLLSRQWSNTVAFREREAVPLTVLFHSTIQIPDFIVVVIVLREVLSADSDRETP